jgi:hypothetical protein
MERLESLAIVIITHDRKSTAPSLAVSDRENPR